MNKDEERTVHVASAVPAVIQQAAQEAKDSRSGRCGEVQSRDWSDNWDDGPDHNHSS